MNTQHTTLEVGQMTTPAAAQPAEGELVTDIVPGPGGVMTDEVGVVTGELTLKTAMDGTTARTSVQYRQAAEWYAVTGAAVTLADPTDLRAVHQVAVALLNRPEG
jgi:hypothetical protein